MSVERMREIFKGDENAVELMRVVEFVSHVWDDLIDGDKPVADTDINRAFYFALVGIRRNPFYLKWAEVIDPLFESGVLNYIASNELAYGSPEDQAIAHTARYTVGDLGITIAVCIGGYEWGAEHAAEIKRMMNRDTLAHFMEEMNEAKNGQSAH